MLIPPRAARRVEKSSVHGYERADEFAWLRDLDDPHVLAHLGAENHYADEVLAPLAPVVNAIADEVASRCGQATVSDLDDDGTWVYYTRYEPDARWPQHLRRPRGDGGIDLARTSADEQVLIDEDVEATGHEFFAAADLTPSPNGQLLAWLRSTSGDETFSLVVRSLADGVDADVVENVGYSLAWGAENSTVYYVRYDEALRPHQVWRHRLGTDPDDDELVFTEYDARFEVAVSTTRSGRWVMIESSSFTTTEVWLVDAFRPDAAPSCAVGRQEGVLWYVDHCNSTSAGLMVAVMTNNDYPEGAIMMAPVSPGAVVGDWEVIATPGVGEHFATVDVFAGAVVVGGRQDGAPGLWVAPPARQATTWELCPLVLPPGVTGCEVGATSDYRAQEVLVSASSPTAPATTLGINLTTGDWRVVAHDVLSDYDPSQYAVERLWATSVDGVAVPMTVVYNPRVSSAGTVLSVYGAYGLPNDPEFFATLPSLLDRGVAYATGHVRGGGEFGRAWHAAGRRHDKYATVADTVACVEALRSWPDSGGQVALWGRSAGGVAVGAAVNTRCDLVAGVVAEVPFVDGVASMCDASLPLTVGEYEEWGEPLDDVDAYRSIAKWSPYDNVTAQPYPPVLATTGLADARVGAWEPAKWVQRLRAHSTGAAPVVLRCDFDSGHLGPTDRVVAWRQEAEVVAFLLAALTGRFAATTP